MANNKNKLVIIAGTVLVLALVGVTVLLLTEKQTNKELVQEFQLEKEDLENEYTRFAQQYDELKLTVSNDSLSVLLEQEQLKTQRLLEELRTVKSSNAAEIRRNQRTGCTRPLPRYNLRPNLSGRKHARTEWSANSGINKRNLPHRPCYHDHQE